FRSSCLSSDQKPRNLLCFSCRALTEEANPVSFLPLSTRQQAEAFPDASTRRWAGRVAECSGLENRRRLIAVPGFESLAHRHFSSCFSSRYPSILVTLILQLDSKYHSPYPGEFVHG